MTSHKHLKTRIRTRMEKTGERYAAARRNVLRTSTATTPGPVTPGSYHLPGNIPAATALRVASYAAGLRDGEGAPLSEAMIFGIAGGVGIGVFSFLYEKENFASFFVGGRHLWHDDPAYIDAALERMGFATVVEETGSAKAADRDLRDLLARGAPVIAFLEAGLLPHRAQPPELLGGGYHVVTVAAIDDATGSVLIGDLGETSVAVPIEAFQAARGRIRKLRHRLVAVTERPRTPTPSQMVRAGLTACHAGLLGAGAVANARGNFTLSALASWADRLVGSGRQSWQEVYPPGPRLWNALTMLYEFIELRGTGGGLSRPLFGEFLVEAGDNLGDAGLRRLGEDYVRLGERWTDLAEMALPPDVAPLAEARDLLTRRSEMRVFAAYSADELSSINARLKDLPEHRFPQSEANYARLRSLMAEAVRAIHAEEMRLHGLIGRWLGLAEAA